jgi:hypothetical protein
MDETNLLSLIRPWLDNICQITTKIATVLFCKNFASKPALGIHALYCYYSLHSKLYIILALWDAFVIYEKWTTWLGSVEPSWAAPLLICSREQPSTCGVQAWSGLTPSNYNNGMHFTNNYNSGMHLTNRPSPDKDYIMKIFLTIYT